MADFAYKRVVRAALFSVAALQVVTGGLLAGGCVCAPSLRTVGLIASVCMSGLVAANIGLALWSQSRPLAAALLAAALQLLLLCLMKMPQLGPPSMAWYVQIPSILSVLTAVLAARKASKQ